MTLYRIKQFIWAITAKVTDEDLHFLKIYLNKDELLLFKKLSICEQKHSIKVAYDVYNFCTKDNYINIFSRKLIKVAILHDIGKIDIKLNLLQKSIFVLLEKFLKNNIMKLGIEKINLYYNHADKSYKILKQFGYDEKFLYLIKNHHNNSIIGDKELYILKKCDDRN